MMEINRQDYWKARSESYEKLRWAKNRHYINQILIQANIKERHIVLDVGTGIGIMADAIAETANMVVALDSSKDMLELNKKNINKVKVEGNIENMIFSVGFFDRIIARSVFQHINNPQKAMSECQRILKPGGKMILAQSIPPSEEIIDEFARIMNLKDDRAIQTREYLFELMENAGFVNISESVFILESLSMKNLIGNNGRPKEVQNKIYDMNINASVKFKDAYNIRSNGSNDMLMDIKNVIIVGEK